MNMLSAFELDAYRLTAPTHESLFVPEFPSKINFYDQLRIQNFIDRASGAIQSITENNFLVKGDINDDPLIGEVIDDVVSAVTEIPRSEVLAQDARTWIWDKTGIQWKLLGRYSYLDDILSTSISSPQTLSFEMPRFQQNYRNYLQLCTARTSGERRTFVEFSPSPVLTEEAKARGYTGKDTIFFHIFDEQTGAEIVVQEWLEAEWSDYNALFKRLGQFPNHVVLTDVSIMQQSNFFDEDNISAIYQFINNNRDAKFAVNQQDLFVIKQVHEVIGETRKFIKREVMPVIIEAALNNVPGKNDGLIYIIEKDLRYIQARVQVMLQQYTQTQLPYAGELLAFVDKMDCDATARQWFVEQNRVAFTGCGMQYQEMSLFSFTAPVMEGALLFQEDDYGTRLFTCSKCMETSIRPYNTLFTHCPKCNGAIPKC